jgi:hypothetical protein
MHEVPTSANSLTPALLLALEQQAHHATWGRDPAQVVRAVGHVLEALAEELRRLGRIRLDAVAIMRADGSSYERIAASTGLSKSRVAQLCATASSTPTRH